MSRDEYLRDMAMPYIKDAIAEGFSEIEVYEGVTIALKELEKFKKSEQDSHEENQSDSNIEIDEKRYFELAEKVLKKKKNGKIFPKRHENALTILYFIHKKEYRNVDDFIAKLSQILNNDDKYLRVKLLGHNYACLYSGIWSFMSKYSNDDNSWERASLSERIELMEKAEKKMYADMLSLEKEFGRG